MTAQPQWSPVDDETADLLSTLAADWRPFAQDDMNTIASAIRTDAETHDGQVHPNRVRGLTDPTPTGSLPVGVEGALVSCDVCSDTGLVDWMIEADPNCYQEPDEDGKIPCPDCRRISTSPGPRA